MKYFATKLSKNMALTPEGFLICLGVPIARVGEYEYGEGETPLEVGDDGKIMISRDEDEVFSEETIASFEGKPFTIKHPEEFVNPKNWSQLAKGVMQNVRRGEGKNKNDLVADILITDAFAISLVNNGLRGLSCGYEAEYTQTGKGRGKQTKIVGNHLALVDEGRAGTAYAIKDEKGVNMKTKKTFAEKMKSLFSTALDEAMAADEESEAPADKKDKSKDESAYDELMKAVKDLGEKVSALKPKSEDEDEEEAPAKDDEEDGDAEGKGKDDEEGGASMEDRMKALETAVAKILEQMAPEAEDEESEEEESEDEESEEAEDDEAEVVSSNTGDTASRAEILAPGIKADPKDIKVKALKAAYGTKDGKQVIDQLTGGKSPAYDKAEAVDTLFVAASELLKSSRSKDLSKTKTFDFQSQIFEADGVMTAEKMNELNAKHYNRK